MQPHDETSILLFSTMNEIHSFTQQVYILLHLLYYTLKKVNSVAVLSLLIYHLCFGFA